MHSVVGVCEGEEKKRVVVPPTVVRIRRSKGVVVQDCDVYIGRAMYQGGWRLPKSKWANPFKLSEFDREQSLKMYEQYIRSKPALMASLHELEGKRLGCWCKPEACHGDVLVRLVLEGVRDCKAVATQPRLASHPSSPTNG